MRRLRSRWTILALVPAFFLAGFAIVSALVDDGDGAEPRAAAGQEAAGTPSAPATSDDTASPTTPTASTEPAATATQAGSPTTTADGGDGAGNGNGNGNGGPPPAPPRGEVVFDYGRWEGMFEVQNPEVVPDFGIAYVTGELRYSGGVDCQIGLIRVRSWFYAWDGRRVGSGLWESTYATGEGGEVTGREPLPFEAYGPVSEAPESAALRFTDVECM